MIDLQKYKRIIRVLFVVVILIFPFYLLVNVRSDYSEFSGETESSFVGKEACKECHEAAYKEWEGSHHDLAMDVANDSTVLGDFSGVEVLGQGKVHHLFKKDGRFFANTDGENGKMADFEIKYVFGYTPLQQYLVEFDKGRNNFV